MNDKHPLVDLAATCACGGAKITVHGQVWSMFLCTCLECQRTTGAGHSAGAIVDANSVVMAGETRAFSRPADSGATLTRHFCSICATTLVAETSRRPEIRLLPVGLFADQSWFTPKHVLFDRSHQHWDILPEDIARHAKYREE